MARSEPCSTRCASDSTPPGAPNAPPRPRSERIGDTRSGWAEGAGFRHRARNGLSPKGNLSDRPRNFSETRRHEKRPRTSSICKASGYQGKIFAGANGGRTPHDLGRVRGNEAQRVPVHQVRSGEQPGSARWVFRGKHSSRCGDGIAEDLPPGEQAGRRGRDSKAESRRWRPHRAGPGSPRRGNPGLLCVQPSLVALGSTSSSTR
jgi:hypothetical protein